MKIHPKEIKISEYDYKLPDEKIAKYPLEKRDNSKLLVYGNKTISETVFSKITEVLPTGSLLVFNDTKVIRARLHFQKQTGAMIEIFCLEPHNPSDYALALQNNNSCEWKCLVGNVKRWKEGALSQEIRIKEDVCKLYAEIVERKAEAFIIRFSWDGGCPFSEVLDAVGAIPIPPYLNRDSETIDEQRYQTVFSKNEGSVAAPTAGLHFTPDIINSLKNKGFTKEKLTLHVGAGTFKPVKSETVGEHHMHTEFFTFSAELIDSLLQNDKIIAVGTTSVRSLESIFQIGTKLLSNTATPLHINQWDAYELPKYNKTESLQAVKTYMLANDMLHIHAKTDILIAPGYDFKIISGMLTNFHQPQSTLLLLVSALIGESWRDIYNYALTHNFRFLSYGDSSLLLKE